MTSPLEKLLGERDWLLADGATGTNLFQAGLQSGDSPELWNEILEVMSKVKESRNEVITLIAAQVG